MKEKLIELIKGVKNPKIIDYLYKFVKAFIEVYD